MASASEAVRKKVMQLQGAHHSGCFSKLIFHMVLYTFLNVHVFLLHLNELVFTVTLPMNLFKSWQIKW